MKNAKVVIFDLDDTLISESDYIRSGYQHISKIVSKNLKRSDNEIYSLLLKLFNESSINVFNRLYDELDIKYSQNTILELVNEYRNHTPDVSFYDDVIPLLNFLKGRKIKTGIITDGYASAQRKKIEVIGATNLFNKIIVTDELGKSYWKPHPKSFEIMKETFNVEYKDIIYVGDNPKKDFYISSIYPIKTIRIKRNNGVYINTPYYENIIEDISISSLNEIAEILSVNNSMRQEHIYERKQ